MTACAIQRPPGSWRQGIVQSLSIALLLCAASVASAAPPPADQPDAITAQLRRSREQQYKSAQNLASTMPLLEVKSPTEVFQLRLRDNRLVCDTPLLDKKRDENKTQYRIELERFKGPTYVNIPNNRALANVKGAAVSLRMFTFTTYSMPNEDELTTVNVQTHPNYTHVISNAQVNNGHMMVRLMDQRNAGNGEAQFQLYVNEYRRDGVQGLNLNLDAEDFPTFLRKYPAESDKYIRPLLRKLGQDAMLSPDPQVAWQVLSDWWKVDETVARKVDALLPELAKPDYREREKAVASLEALGRPGAAVLVHLDRRNLNAEQNLLIDRALAPFAQLPARQAEQLRNDKAFLLDCLYGDDPEVRSAALARLHKLTEKQIPFDTAASEAERIKLVDQLRGELLKEPKGTTTK